MEHEKLAEIEMSKEDVQQETVSMGSLFKNKRKLNQNLRKRNKISGDINEEPDFIKTKALNKLRKTDSNKANNESSEGKNVIINYKADETSNLQSKERDAISGATATVEIHTDFSNDSRAILERQLKEAKETVSASKDNIYKGATGYNTYIEKRETAAGSIVGSKMKAGPIRAASNIRVTNRFDYQPDICKDYKETGFCGYGDSCKFLHDRGDYKSGWQLEREWEEEQARKRERILKGLKEVSDESDSEEEELPFACLICRKTFVNPVVTDCGHYFCEACALKRFAKTPKCFACHGPTGGIFNIAINLIQKLKTREEREAKESSSDNEGKIQMVTEFQNESSDDD